MRNRVASCAIVMSCCLMASCDEPPPPEATVRPVQTMRVTSDPERPGRRFPGQAKAVQEVDLSFRVSGTLIELPVDVGDRVEAGQTAARLDPRDFEVQIKDHEATVALASANLAAAEDDLQRTQDALSSGAATEFELTMRREARNAAAAQVDSAEAKLESARDALSYATLRAPFAGDVTVKYVDNFQDVAAGSPVVRILDDSRVEMLIYVPEHLMSAAPTATDLRCEFDAFPGLVVPAEFKEIGTEADPVTRTYPITLIMDQPDGTRILPGMTGNAWALRRADPPDPGGAAAFTIPLSALGEDAGGARFVWLVSEQGSVSRKDIEVGELVLGGVRVRGLQEGDQIATAGAAFLSEGQQVKPVATPPGDGA